MPSLNEKAGSLLCALVLAISVCTASFAQSSEPPERPKRHADPDAYFKPPSSLRGKLVVLPIGTTFEGRVDRTISSENSHGGERFNVVVDSPVLVNGTDVVIPQGSQIIGEVVEAVPASAVPHQPWQQKALIHGKLRVQLFSVRTPDGIAHPLVATLAGDAFDQYHKYMQQYQTPLGTSVGYVGSQAGFAAVNANSAPHYGQGPGPHTLDKQQFLRDNVMGMGADRSMDNGFIRSLVLKHRDYFIYKGSPLTIKLTAPFKIGMDDPGMGVSVGSLGEQPRSPGLPPPSGGFPQPSPMLPAVSPPLPANGGFSPPSGSSPAPAQAELPAAGAPQRMPPQGQGVIPPDSF